MFNYRRFFTRLCLWVCALTAVSLLLLACLGLYLSLGKSLSERHQPYKMENSYNFQQGSFEGYIGYSQNHLRQARLPPPSDSTVLNASPFELKPNSSCEKDQDGLYTNGIVLTHGLIASPYSMREIAEYFQSRCFWVLAILLPDHATRPGDFLNTHWQTWAEAQHYATKDLQSKVKNVYLSGHSIGAELALYEAGLNPAVKALILFTPAIEIAAAAKYAKYMRLLGTIFPKAAWFEIRNDDSLYRYESITFSAARESYALIQATNKIVAESTSIPIFTIASMEDNTVNTNAVLAFMKAQKHPHSRTLLYSQHPMSDSENIKVVTSANVDLNILSVSHLGIMLSPNHPEYGREGAYRSCGHYFSEPKKFALCKSGKRDHYGEVTKENLELGVIERIAFNPYYQDLLKEIDLFLDQLE